MIIVGLLDFDMCRYSREVLVSREITVLFSFETFFIYTRVLLDLLILLILVLYYE